MNRWCLREATGGLRRPTPRMKLMKALICTRVELPPPPFGSDQMLCAHEPKLVSACLVLVSMQTGLEVKVVRATFMYVGIYSEGTVKGKKQRKELVAALLKNKLDRKSTRYPKRDATKLTGDRKSVVSGKSRD